MERLKGLLKRRSGEIRTAANDFSEMEVVSDPENTAEIQANRMNNVIINAINPIDGSDDTYPLMMEKIETLTMEKYSLEERLGDLTSQLEAKTQENFDLKSRCDDLLQSLELEKSRFRWQQKFYEKRIQQLQGIPTSSSSNSMMDTVDNNDSSNPETEQNGLRCSQSMEDILGSNAFYEDTIKALVIVQENQSTEMRNLRKYYEDKLKNLSLEHEHDVSEIIEAQHHEVQKLIGENEGLIRDLLTGCEGLFDDLKSEYTVEASLNTELKTKSGTNIITQFHELPPLIKGITIAGITVISVATAGWASWGFIIWVWPRLIAFAEVLAANPETFYYLFAFLNSVPFQNFTRAWEEGKSLGECLKAFANTEFLSSALRMAPDLFTQFKKFPRPIAN